MKIVNDPNSGDETTHLSSSRTKLQAASDKPTSECVDDSKTVKKKMEMNGWTKLMPGLST